MKNLYAANKQSTVLIFFLTSLTVLLGTESSLAKPGWIDSTFRSGGTVTSNFGGAAYASVLQVDGKMILAGRATGDFTLLRFNPDGTADNSFGANGRASVDIPGGDNEIPFAVTVQTDGKIVAAGQFQNGTGFDYDFGLVRFNPDGTADASFGSGGMAAISIGDNEDIARSIIVQPDGKLLVGGSAFFFGGTNSGRFAVVRFNENGTLDTTFDTDGKAIVQQNGFGDIALQPDGKIVVASSDGFGSSSNFAASRLLSNGSIDTSFGTGGKVITSFDSGESLAYSVGLQPDGKIITAGTSYAGSGQNYDFAMVRYNGNGTPDLGFDVDGKVTTSFGNLSDTARDFALQPNGNIVVAGYAQGKGFALARFLQDGSLDTTFDGDGKTTAQLLGGDYAYELEFQLDGKIVAVGTGGGSPTRFVAIRFNTNGGIDQNFNTGLPNRVTVSQGEINGANVVVVQPDGKILAAGATSTFSLLDFSLVRLNADGTSDLTFGVGGKVSTSVSSSIDGALAVALQTDGKIVAAGYTGIPGITDMCIVRYNPDGTLDISFDSDGIVVLSRNGPNEAATGVVVQPDGKIVVGGYSDTSSGFMYFMLVRFNLNGSIDTSFGTNGIVSTDIGSGNDFATALLLQNDDKLIAVGTSRTGTDGDFAAIRYLSDGSLDAAFGNGGKVVTPFGTGNDDATSASLQADGKILVAGNSFDGSTTNFALVRLNTNGAPDSLFGDNGKTGLSLGNSGIESVTVQGNGRIVAVGQKTSGGSSDIVVARFNSSGLPDPTFGNGGVSITDIDDRDLAKGVAVQGANRILVAGSAYGPTQTPPQANMVVIRYVANTGTLYDFNGDGSSDVSIHRPSNNIWYLVGTTAGFTTTEYGVAGDKLAPADFDGDGRTDVAVFRPSTGQWFIAGSTAGFYTHNWGEVGDLPVPSDYDGDGRADVAVFRSSNSTWYLKLSADNSLNSTVFGTPEDKPQIGDFDGDGRADLALYRPSTNNWYFLATARGFSVFGWGQAGDIPSPADYDGDGRTDPAVFRPSIGTWYIAGSNAGFFSRNWGTSGDIPAVADFDGDGMADVAVFRPSEAVWYVLRSTAGIYLRPFGASQDKPIPSIFAY